jgi:peroxiredoxin
MRIAPGDHLPDCQFGEIENGELRTRSTVDIFATKRVALIGAPAAFSPVCTRLHLPRFVALAPQMLASGFDAVVCVSTSTPWSLAAWAAQIDPAGLLRFISDGNRDFSRGCGLTAVHKEIFLGVCMARFSMTVHDQVVQRVAVENSVMEVTCSSAATLLQGAA